MTQELCETLNEKLKQIRTLQIRIGELEAKNADLFQDKRSYIKYALELKREIDKFKREIKPQKLMHYEDRNTLSYQIVKKVIESGRYEITNEENLAELYDKVEELLEPYTTGTYKNYN